jgi:hypothetical protein
MFKMSARIPPKYSLPLVVMLPRIDDKSERSASAIIGEKSILPKRSQVIFENSLRYGSVMEVMNLPNLVNLAPGIQVIKIAIIHKMAYIIKSADKKERIVLNML